MSFILIYSALIGIVLLAFDMCDSLDRYPSYQPEQESQIFWTGVVMIGQVMAVQVKKVKSGQVKSGKARSSQSGQVKSGPSLF